MVRIEQTLLTPTNLARPLGPNALLPIGRVLDAVVIQQRAGQLYELSSGPLRLLAESQQPLRPGEQLNLRVTGRDSAQRPTLEVIPRNIVATTPFLKTVLPQQQEPTKLLAALWQLSQSKPDNPILQRAAQLVEQLPGRQQLVEPGNLQRTLLNSGLFLEQQLQGGRPIPDGDLKLALLKLLRALSGQQTGQSTAKPSATTSSDRAQPQQANTSTAQPATTTPGKPAASQPGTPTRAQTAQPSGTGGERPSGDTYTRPLNSGPTARAAPTTGAAPGGGTGTASGSQSPGGQPLSPGSSQTPIPTSIRNALPGQVQPLPRAETPPAMEIANLGKFVAQLAKNTESTLARIESHQLLHLQSQDSSTPQWLLEIPVRDKDGIDLWQLHIAREDKESDQEGEPADRVWHLTLSFDFPNTGSVITRVEYTAEKTAITFYAESADTDALIGDQTESFKQLLEDKGILGVNISHHQGLPHKDILPSALHSVLEDQA